MHAYRTHSCAELRQSNVGETVRLSGWVHRKRDHGHLLFVDLRDHYGITQIVTDTDSPAFKTLDRLRVESVVTVEGEVDASSFEPDFLLTVADELRQKRNRWPSIEELLAQLLEEFGRFRREHLLANGVKQDELPDPIRVPRPGEPPPEQEGGGMTVNQLARQMVGIA